MVALLSGADGPRRTNSCTCNSSVTLIATDSEMPRSGLMMKQGVTAATPMDNGTIVLIQTTTNITNWGKGVQELSWA